MRYSLNMSGYRFGSRYGEVASHIRRVVVADPYAAHVAALRSAAPGASGYYTARDYTASTSQAGRFVDAFGGPLTYDAPNVMASPTRVVDPGTGMVYTVFDGGDDTAICNQAQTVAAYTAVFRSPPGQTTWSNYGAVIDNATSYDVRLGHFNSGHTTFDAGFAPRSLRRDGVALASPYDLNSITQWMVVSLYTHAPTALISCSLAALNGLCVQLHLAELLTWATDPSAAEAQATEQEMMRYYTQQYGLTFS